MLSRLFIKKKGMKKLFENFPLPGGWNPEASSTSSGSRSVSAAPRAAALLEADAEGTNLR